MSNITMFLVLITWNESVKFLYFIDQLFYTYENSTMVIGQFDHVSLLSFHSFLHLIFVPF